MWRDALLRRFAAPRRMVGTGHRDERFRKQRMSRWTPCLDILRCGRRRPIVCGPVLVEKKTEGQPRVRMIGWGPGRRRPPAWLHR